MTFKVIQLAHRPWPVTVTLQVCDEAGNVVPVEQTFVGHFCRFDDDVHDEATKAADAALADAAPGTPVPGAMLRAHAIYFGRLMCGWSGVAAESGAEIPFSPEALTNLVCGPDGQAVANGLFRAIAEIRAGVAPTKNSPTSVEPGAKPSAAEVATTATAPT